MLKVNSKFVLQVTTLCGAALMASLPSAYAQRTVSTMDDYSVDAMIELSLKDGKWRINPSTMKTYLEVERVDRESQVERQRLESARVREQINQLDQQLKERAEVEQAIDDIAMEGGFSPQNVDARISELNEQILQLKVELRGQEFRRTIATEQLQQLQANDDQQAETDPVMVELRRILELEKKSLERIERMYAAAAVPERDVQEGQARIGEIKMRMLEREEDLNASSRDPRIQLLNEDILTSTLAIAELKAKVDELQKAADRFADGRRQMNVLKNRLRVQPVSQSAYDMLTHQQLKLEQDLFQSEIELDRIITLSKKLQERQEAEGQQESNDQ